MIMIFKKLLEITTFDITNEKMYRILRQIIVNELDGHLHIPLPFGISRPISDSPIYKTFVFVNHLELVALC